MKRLTLTTICAVALILFACNNEEKKEEKEVTASDSKMGDSSAAKIDKKNDHTYVMPDSATMMKNWMAYMTPGEVHKMIASWNGTWNGDVTMWHTPDAPPEKSTSTTTNKMIMGGRYQVANHSGNMMGTPFEGMSTLGYDNDKKKFVSTWIDNMGTGVMTLEGDWNASNKSMTLTGKMVNPATGDGSECEIREVFRVIDDNNQVMEMYGYTPDGKEFKTMEIKYTRKK